KAEMEHNKAFHYPKNGKPVVMVSNGTGIAPFLGMLHGTDIKYLYWGGKNQRSFQLYEPHLANAKKERRLTDFKTVFSREKAEIKYVQELVEKDADPILKVLDEGGTLMICGSVQMQNGILLTLGNLCDRYNRHL